MLEAKKNKWFEKIFAVYNRNLLNRRFDSLRVSGLKSLREIKREYPLVIYANHSSWWDGLVAFQISKTAGLDSFIMMEEKHLKKLFLFRRLGAFSVTRESPFKAVKSINYAVNLLKENSKRALWIFPQGEILPNDVRPLKFFTGLSKIILQAEYCYMQAIAMRYEFTGAYKPEIFVKINKPVLFDNKKQFSSKNLTKTLEENLTESLTELKVNVVNKQNKDFENII